MGDFGGRVSKQGVNVLTGADKDMLWTTKLRGLNIRAKGIANATSFNFAHGLGYKPAFAGYIKDATPTHFLNYHHAPFDGYQFENTTYGDIYTDGTNLHCECATANKLVYLCYLNPANGGSGATSPAASKDHGLRMSNDGVDVLTGEDGQMLIHSKYQSPLIILADAITVNVSAISADPGFTVRQSDFTDYTHGRAQANHIIMPDLYSSVMFAYSTEPSGLGPDYIVYDVEVSIDATKIRVRVSAVASSSFATISANAFTYSPKFFLTNIILPT